MLPWHGPIFRDSRAWQKCGECCLWTHRGSLYECMCASYSSAAQKLNFVVYAQLGNFLLTRFCCWWLLGFFLPHAGWFWTLVRCSLRVQLVSQGLLVYLINKIGEPFVGWCWGQQISKMQECKNIRKIIELFLQGLLTWS